MGASCSLEQGSGKPSSRTVPPRPSRMLGNGMSMVQPRIAGPAKPLNLSTCSLAGSTGACNHGTDLERRGSTSVHLGSIQSTSTAHPMLIRHDSAVFLPPSSPLSKSNPPPAGRMIRATGEGSGVSQCSLRSASAKARHRRCASTMSTGSADSTNTWTQLTAHDATASAAPHLAPHSGGEPLWALARFRSDGPLSC
jgi:hypothetical protein